MEGVHSENDLDLNRPRNFAHRSTEEQRRAAAYFLRAGAVGSFYERVSWARKANPDFTLDLRGADLSNASLWGIELDRADFSKAFLDGANFSDASLVGVNFAGAVLTDATFTGADLSGADMTGADLRGANLDDAGSLDGIILTDTIQGPSPNAGKKARAPIRADDRPAFRRRASGNQKPVETEGLGSHQSIGTRKDPVGAVAQSGKGAESPESEEARIKREKEQIYREGLEAQKAKKEAEQKVFEKKQRDKKRIETKRREQDKQRKEHLAKEKRERTMEMQKEKQYNDQKRREQEAFDRKKRADQEFFERKRQEEKNRGKR